MAQYKQRRSGQDGFSLATVMLIALALILGSIAMIDRATSGWLGSLFVGQSREARDAAEIGLARVVSQLNRSRNRRLLVNADLLDKQSYAIIEAPSSTFTAPCETEPPDLSASGTNHTAGEFSGTKLTAEEQQIETLANGNEKSYQVLSVSQPQASSQSTGLDANNKRIKNPGFTVSIGNDQATAIPGSIIIRVQGLVRRPGQPTGTPPLASTIITETLTVVPKCCRRSFSGFFGNDTRPCDWPPLGVVVGTDPSPGNTGGLTASGASVSFTVESEDQPLASVTCASTCTNSLNANVGTIVKEEDVELDQDMKVFTGSNPRCELNSTSYKAETCNINLSKIKQAEGITGNKLILNSSELSGWPGALRAVCKEEQLAESTDTNAKAIYCSMNSLDFGENNLEVEFITSAGQTTKPVRLYFPNPQDPLTTKTINQRNNGSFTHTTATGKITDLVLLGCYDETLCSGDGKVQYVDLGNGTSDAFDVFSYFRNGIVNIGGNGSYTGVLWANRINVNGNVTFTVPTNAVADVITLLKVKPLVDWVARSTQSISLF